MHELGIIVHISRTLDEVAKENNLTEIGSVTLEIGEVSRHSPGLYDRLLEVLPEKIGAF